ncbi:hypothetical protein QBC41DRAFT_59894 [Cercophora samala]|uniref:Uncharacterized protein n=1 Tax=Cercophora samala TaxID=330535 RepID=A0AA40DEF2_9PEZI|nr:hypothetical protein QBC41DRAFT_59894 [Cercophora samala]
MLCREVVVWLTGVLTAVNRAGEIAALTYRNSQGERVNAYVPLPASRSSQTGERRPSPSDPSTENMRRTRPRFGSARGYGAPTAPNLTNTPGSRPGPPHGAFPSMAGFPGSVGPAPAGAFQPNGPLGASGEQQMPFPGPSVFVPFTQESAVGLTGLFRARGQLQPDTGSNSSMGRGTLRRRPVTTSSSLFRYSAPPPPVDSLRSPSILRPNLSAFTSLLLDHNPQLLTHQGYPPPFLPLPNTRRGQNTSTYSTTRDGQSNADLIAEAGAQFRAEMLGPSSAPSASRPESQAVREPAQPPGPLQSPTPDLLDLERDFGYPPPQAPQNPRGAAGEPPHKRRRSGSGSEGEQ